MRKRIIIVSNRLPINITKEGGKLQAQRSNGGVATALASLLDGYESLWIGWTGISEPVKRWQLAVLHGNSQLIPVDLTAELLRRYYTNFANGVLWPLLHGFQPRIPASHQDWEAYRAANLRFAQAIQRTCRPGDAIWIHDYHLMLVPQMLRDLGVRNRIGFFLHTPFAAPACLSAIPQCRELLAGLASADVLGTQTDGDARCLTAALQSADLPLREGAVLQAFPIGVNYQMHHTASQLPAVQHELAHAAEATPAKRIIVSVSRLDYTKGITEQLKAYELLLSRHPNPEQCVYKLIVAPSREDAPGYAELKAEIERLVARINMQFGRPGRPVVDYTYRNCDFAEVSAWYLLADVLLVTPSIDGMNLVAKEFVATRPDNDAMLIISKTMGAARQLTAAPQADPSDVADIAKQLERALFMNPEESALRWRALRRNVQTEDVFWWVESFMQALQPQVAAAAQHGSVSPVRLGERLKPVVSLAAGSPDAARAA